MNSNRELGKTGEHMAETFLKKQEYRILEKNYRFKRSEIDLIIEKNGVLAFIEVKYRSTSSFGMPESFVSERQQEKIREGAEQYLIESKWQGPIRFDILSILTNETGEQIDYFKDAF